MTVRTIDLASVSPEDVRQACEEVGFLTVVGHGVADDLVDEVAARSRAFFDLPDAEKERFRAPAETRGRPVYRPLGAEKLGANADRKASLDWGPSLAGVAWPNAELRAAYERYYAELQRVAATLVAAFGAALGSDLSSEFDDRSSSLRVIDYPTLEAAAANPPPPGDETAPRSASPAGSGTGARAGAHRDYGCLTIIRSDAPGLEVQTRNGEWLAVQPPPGGFVVNIGDLMQFWTADRWVSTLHRVVGEGAAPRRQSLVFFHNPRADAVINGVRAEDYILARAAEAGL